MFISAERTLPRAWDLRLAGFAAIVTAYLVIGVTGHDPWKQDETYIFGAVQHLLETRDWIVPAVAGEPFMEKPPLYYWVAAGFARLFSGLLPLHDGARLATPFFMIIACAAIAWTARRWWGAEHDRFALLALLGCLGIFVDAHMMLTDIPVLTGFALASCGFVLARSRAVPGGLFIALGVSVGFLGKGLLAPGVIGLSAMLLPVCFRDWREPTYARALAIAAAAALPAFVIWPLALYLRSPSLFQDWFWLNNIGRFLGFAVPKVGAEHSPGFWLKTLPWFAFPAMPLALVTLWRSRGAWSGSPPIQFSVVVSGVMIGVLLVSGCARGGYAIPLLVPLCLLAAPAAASLPTRLDRRGDWGLRILFGTIAAFIWTVWIVMVLRGAPPDWPMLARYVPPRFVPDFDRQGFSVAFGMTVLAAAFASLLPEVRGRALMSWTAGIALCWTLLSSLWFPWIDFTRSYRGVFLSLNDKLPAKYRCVTSVGLGESERAMLHYYAGVDTQRPEIGGSNDCDVLLVQGIAGNPRRRADLKARRLVWEGARPGDDRQRFWLFASPSASSADSRPIATRVLASRK